MYSWLAEAIAEDAEVITASRRLARELRDAYNTQQLALGRSAWRTPPVRSWHDWLNGLVSGLANPSSVAKQLDPVSSALLMEKCLRMQLPDGLPGAGGIIRQAIQSWQRVCEWRVPPAELQSSARSHDEIAFAKAAQEYQQRLNGGGWIDSAGIAELAGRLIEQKAVGVANKVVLAGFDRLSPSAKHIVSALESVGCEVVVNGNRGSETNASTVSYDSAESELRAAGAWAREILEDDPDTTIAIVSPALETNAPAVARLVREGLVPGWQYGNRSHASAANVSYGRKLAEYPLIEIALLLLRWTFEGLTGRELSLLLRSRCVARLPDRRSKSPGTGHAAMSGSSLVNRRVPALFFGKGQYSGYADLR